jgi:hypothetical protein
LPSRNNISHRDAHRAAILRRRGSKFTENQRNRTQIRHPADAQKIVWLGEIGHDPDSQN